MFVWSSSASPVSDVFGGNDFGASQQSGRSDQGAKEIRMLVADHPQDGETKGIISTSNLRTPLNYPQTNHL